jgi:hypothetical protein
VATRLPGQKGLQWYRLGEIISMGIGLLVAAGVYCVN